MAPIWIVLLFGILTAGCSLFFVVNPRFTKKWLGQILKVLSSYALRILGFIGLLIGILLIIWAVV